MDEDELIEIARRYLRAIEDDLPASAMAAFFTEDVVQREYPNRLVPQGATRDLAALLEAGERGRAVVEGQRYAVRSAIARGEAVAMEIDWSATLRVPVGTLAAGDVMRASFAVFLTFREGKIASQRNYDCFEPF